MPTEKVMRDDPRGLVAHVLEQNVLSDKTALACFGLPGRRRRSPLEILRSAAWVCVPPAAVFSVIAAVWGHFILVFGLPLGAALLAGLIAFFPPFRWLADILLNERDAETRRAGRASIMAKLEAPTRESLEEIESKVSRIHEGAAANAMVVDELFGLSELTALYAQMAVAHTARSRVLREVDRGNLEDRVEEARGNLRNVLEMRAEQLAAVDAEVDELENAMSSIEELIHLLADSCLPANPSSLEERVNGFLERYPN